MAKKKQQFELDDDDFGFGADLDIPDFGFEPEAIKDDRSAVTKVATGVKDGVRDTVMSPSFVRKMIKKSLPVGYGSALDMADETAGTFQNLYNDAAKEIKPAIKDLKRVTKRILPNVESALPKKMAEKIKKWADHDPDKISAGMNAEQMREASLQAQMGEIFQFQTQQQAKDKAENEARETIRDSVEHDRHRDMLGQLDAMRVSLQQLAGYQEKVDAAYKRKSLELQFRHYFVAVDLLEEQKKFNAEAKTNLDGIMKNTGLPDYVKLKDSERLKEVMRNKFIDGIQETIFGKRRQLLGNIGKRLSATAKEKLGGFLNNFRDGLGMAETMTDMVEMGQENPGMGPGAHELSGNIAGSMVADSLGGRAGKLIRKGINKYDTEGRVDRYGNKLQYGVENAPQLLVDYARSDKHESGGMFDGLVRAFKEAVLSSNSVDNSIIGDRARNMQDPQPFNRGAHKSLTEIIPGYLARIYRELQITRTGNTDIQLATFDYNSNKFVERSKLKGDIFKSVVSEHEKTATQEQLKGLIDEIDPEKKFTDEQRKILGHFLLTENMRNASGSAERMKNYETFTGKAGRYADLYSEAFEKYFEDDKSNSKKLDFTRTYNQLGRSISDQRAVIQDHVNTGNRELLEELGLLNGDQINMPELMAYMSGEKELPNLSTPATSNSQTLPNSGTPRRNRRRRPNPPPQPQRPTPQAPPQPATDAGFSQAGLQGMQQLIEAIKAGANDTQLAIKNESVKSISQAMHDILDRIEKKLNKGVTINIGGGVPGGATADGGGAVGGRWRDRSIGSLASGAFDFTTKWGGKAGRFLTDGITGAARNGWSASTTGLGWMKDYAKKTYDQVKGMSDVFIKGEVEPRLLAAKLKAGKYKDAVTGKVITSYKDIKNGVIDADTGEFVLTKDDLKNMFAKSGVGKKLISLSSWGVGKLSNLASGIAGGLPGAVSTVLKFANSMRKKGLELLDQPEDIYVEGEELPVLLARTMKAGGYRSKKTGETIERPSQIDGAVLDLDGNVALTAEEFGKGIFNNKGKPIRSGLGKITGLVKDIAMGGINKVMGLFNWGKGKMAGKGSGFGDWFKGLFSGSFQLGGGGSSKTLLQIRNLLNERLPGEPTKFDDRDVGRDLMQSVREKASSLVARSKKASPELVMKAKEMYQNLKDRGLSRAEIMKEMGTDLFNLTRSKGRLFMDRVGNTAKALKTRALSLFGGFARKDGLEVSGMGKLAKLMEEMRDRLPKPKKHVIGDMDGDGIRDGSSGDPSHPKKTAKEKLKEAAAKAGEKTSGAVAKGKSLLGTVGSGARSLYNKFRGRKGRDEETDEDGNPLTDLAGDVASDTLQDRLDRRRPRGRGRGRLGRAARGARGRVGSALGKLGGWGLKGAGKMLGVAGAAYGAYSAYDNFKQGNYGEAALDAGMSAGGLAMSGVGLGAITGGLGTAASIGGSILAGAAGLISAPVVLGALAVGGLGYLAYKAYTKKKLDTWSKIRYAQYGFLPTDTDHVQKVFELEDALKKGVTYSNGQANLEEKKLDFKSIVKDFGISLNDKTAVQAWLQWFLTRFKPVYLVHMSALNKVAPGKSLDDVSGLKAEEKKQYLEIAKFPPGPYDVTISPFSDLKSLPAGASEVKTVVEMAEAELKKEGDGKKEGETGLEKPAAVAAGAAAATTVAAATLSTPPKVSAELISSVKTTAESDTGLGDSRGIITSMGVPIAANKFSTGRLGGLAATRYKTYGLKELVLDKVRSLDALEEYVNKGVKYGKGNVAVWEGSVEKALLTMGPVFGVEGASGNDASNWLAWFSQRFLPTYMNYLTAVAAATGKTDIKSGYVMLKPQQMVDVAMVVYTTKGKGSGSTMSVWQLSPSPWPNYELNTDVKSVEPNVNGLKEDAKRTVLDEQKGRTAAGKDAQSNPAAPTTFMGKAAKAVSDTWQSVKDSVTGLFGGPKVPDTNGGREILQPGNGTGGDVNAIPKPTGNKSWAALKDTIMAAAKMVGVDGKLMATMAALESGFDYTVKAGTSSASGLYQFIDSTWQYMLKKFGGKYGIDPNTRQTDPRANALMGAEYMKESVDSLTSSLKRPLTDTDIYMAHFLGPGGAKKFLAADPNALAASIMPKEAAANKSIFYKKDGSPRTVAEVYELMNQKVRSGGSKFGVDAGSEAIVTSSGKAATGGTPPAVEAKKDGNAAPTTTAAPVVAATAAAKVAPNALGIPVSDTTPGAPPAPSSGSKEVATKTQAVPKAAQQPVSADVAAMGAGFGSSRARDLQAQSQYQRDLKDEALSSIDDTGKKQLAVQIETRDALVDLLKFVRGGGLTPPAPNAPPSAVKVTPPRQAQAVTPAPVSMSKPNW